MDQAGIKEAKRAPAAQGFSTICLRVTGNESCPLVWEIQDTAGVKRKYKAAIVADDLDHGPLLLSDDKDSG